MSNLTYLWSQGMVDKIAEKVANERPSKADEIIERVKNQNIKSQHIDHVEAERLADLARERQRELAQMEMFDDPWENWSGHR
jgi:CRISPR/Cas system CSM-associated protein Csm5 (group 7 of RAMP superfamily)